MFFSSSFQRKQWMLTWIIYGITNDSKKIRNKINTYNGVVRKYEVFLACIEHSSKMIKWKCLWFKKKKMFLEIILLAIIKCSLLEYIWANSTIVEKGTTLYDSFIICNLFQVTSFSQVSLSNIPTQCHSWPVSFFQVEKQISESPSK